MTKRGSIDIGPLTRNSRSGKHYLPKAPQFTPPTRVTNATVSSTNPLDLTKLWANSAQRPGALDFMKCKSRGTGC
jgi:hypothetical protein